VSSAAATEHHGVEPTESPLTPESWGKLGMWNFLAADAMTFGAALAAYGALRYGDPSWPNPTDILGIGLTAAMTFLLICSSVTMVEALAGIRQNNQAKMVRFLALTALGGVIFLACQAYEWNHLLQHGAGQGLSLTRHNFDATFFIITGFHGLHVFSGVVYLTIIMLLGMRGRFSATNHNEVEIAGLYWHFVDLIWILVFTFVYLL
jgi:heme/copper-type cytochrome/quinol oxidase subunit 3